MYTRKLSVAIATTALVVCVPLAMVYPGAAAAAPANARAVMNAKRAALNAERAARAAATARLSGVPCGGAALYL